MEKTSLCYCDTEMPFESCCAPILSGDRFARTAQELLRARFSAFPVRNADFLMHTHHSDTRHEVVREDLEAWMESSAFQRLEIHEASDGGESDTEGTIFFTAYFTKKEGGLEQKHSEKSYFKKYEGEWRFWDAEAIHFGTYQRPEPKIGRNDICPCGSGKKFKKCCGS